MRVDDSCAVTANQACCRQDDKLRLATSGAFCVSGGLTADILKFRTKRLTGFMPEDEQRETENCPEQTSAKPVADTAPCEMGQEDSGDCA